MSEEELRALFEAAVATMAKLHDLNWKELGLECLGDSEDYLRKRVSLRMLNLVARKTQAHISGIFVHCSSQANFSENEHSPIGTQVSTPREKPKGNQNGGGIGKKFLGCN